MPVRGSRCRTLRACGLGLRQLGLPVLGLALLVSGLAAYLALDVEKQQWLDVHTALMKLWGPQPQLSLG